MTDDILLLERVAAEDTVNADLVPQACYFKWTGTTKDTLLPTFR